MSDSSLGGNSPFTMSPPSLITTFIASHRMEGRVVDALFLVHTQHYVHHLDGVARRSLEQVVDRPYRDDSVPAFVQLEAYVAEVGPDDNFRVGEAERALLVLHHPYERLVGIDGTVHLPDAGVLN